MFLSIIIIILSTFISIISCYVYYKLTFWTRQNIPNEVSSIYNRFTSPFHISDRVSSIKYGPIVGIYEGLRPVLMITDLELISKLLIEQFNNFPNHRIFYHENQVAGQNIVVLEDEKWRKVRKIMSPIFSMGKLRKMKPAFDTCVDTLIKNFDTITLNGSTSAIIDAKDYFGSFSIDVICSVVFNVKIDSINNPNHVLVTNIKSFFGHDITINKLIIFFFPSLMKLFNLYLFNYEVLIFLNNFTKNILKERKRNEKIDTLKMSKNFKDFIQLLMDAKNEEDNSYLSDQQIADQVILFLVAGYDTSAATLSSISYCLALNDHVQEKLYQEVYNLYQKKDFVDDFSFEDIENLKYLDAVINETLRFLPIVPRIERRSNKKCSFGSLTIPKDTMIVVPIYTLNHDEKYFKDPEIFDPERFINMSKSEDKNWKKFFIPFAAGPRNCIGMKYALMELKCCISRLVLQYKFLPCEQTKVPLEYYTGQPVSTAKDVRISIEKRSTSC